MAAAVVGTDIDSFIREQKAKLASERNALNDSDDRQPPEIHSRRQWDRQAGRGAPLAVEESRPRTQESGLPLGNSKATEKQRQLAEQRKREYNEILRQTKGTRPVPAVADDDSEISNPSIIPFNRADQDQERKRRMEEERQREYQQMKAKLDETHRRGRREATERGRQPERRAADRGSLLEQTDEYKANLPGMNDSDMAKIEKERQRNDEYNQYLRENSLGRRTRNSDRTPDREADSEYYATLPGLRDSHSAKVRKEQQRNREYNEFLASRGSQRSDGKPPPAPRKGWSTPTYEDILDKKREQEAQYRRANDPGYGYPADTREYVEPQRNVSPLQLPRTREASRTRESPRAREAARSRDSSREKSSDYYATLPIGSESASKALPSQPGPYTSEEAKRQQKERYREELQRQMREVAEGRRREKQAEMQINYSGEKKLDMKVDFTGYKDPEEQKAPQLPPQSSTTTTTTSQRPTLRASQPSYQSDGLDRLDQLNPRAEFSRGRSRLGEDLDRNPASRGSGGVGAGRGLLDTPFTLSRGSGGARGGGLLDDDFTRLLEAPRHGNLAPPPGLEYQPASFITQNGAGGGGLGQTSVEDAYNFYATYNPLEADLPAARSGGAAAAVSRPLQTSQDAPYTGRRDGGGGGGGGGGGLSDRNGGGMGLSERSRARVRFEDEEPRKQGMDFPSDDDKKRQAQRKAQAYQEELNRQIEEKRRKKILEKEEKERYDRKLEQEALNYNPYGRGGGGAPMRDAYGNIVTDLRSVRRDGDNPDSSRRAAPPPPPSYPSPYDNNPSGPVATASTRDDLFGPPPMQTTAEGEQSHARGGHGIFGLPKTSEEKVASEKYKEDLRRQIEERKIEEMRKKELERQEEEREQRRLEEQRQRMQREYEEEQRKLKEKEEEARKKNEELVRQAEERKRAAERQRKEAEEKRLEEERREKEAEMNARLASANADRGKSPVIPTLRHKQQETSDDGNVDRGKSPVIPALRHKQQENNREARGDSPPVPAARSRAADGDEPVPSTSKQESAPASRAASADVLNQLAVMRRQLQNERQRVEDMLQTDKKSPDVFDPRLVQKPPTSKPEVDVFETARQGNAVAVRRTPGDRANGQTIEDFNALKHKDDSDSRKEFLKLFPDRPASGDALEAQQAALLRQQEQSLRALREQRGKEEAGLRKVSFPPQTPRGQQARTPQQLNSNSAFVDVDGLNYFPDDFDDMPSSRRNESARARRRGRLDSSPRAGSVGGVAPDPFGSSTSLNVDRLARKNEDRLKRLRELQGDDLSLYDPDDVLDRFMSKQSQHRPPSGQTLQDDSWLTTGAASKAGY
ncbi:uncharacterized protein LOC143295526 isoform X3 [Babylonia areolata]|uniref:uncharacterized protein LOC143295526 isoform X3 n=1 Tax=Babylonia areolata TaxID=304850 RepID=UPI003FD3C13E